MQTVVAKPVELRYTSRRAVSIAGSRQMNIKGAIMQRINVNKKYVWAFYLLGILGMAVFAVYDLNISMKLCNRENIYGQFIEALGDYPLYLMLGTGSVYLFMQEKRNIILRVLWAAGALAGAGLCALLPIYRIAEIKTWHFILIPVFLTVFVLAVKRVPEDKREMFTDFALQAVIYFVAAQVIAYSIKLPWGRLRFRNMTDPVSQFIPWYLPQGITGNYSFPSGHTFNSCSVFLLMYLPQLKKGKAQNRKTQMLLWMLCGGWVLLVAVGRIVAGAHFASDVTMGAMLGVGTFLIMNKQLVEKRGRVK